MTTIDTLAVRAAERWKDPGNAVVTSAQWFSYINEAYHFVNAYSPLWPWLETSEQTLTFTPNASPTTARTAALPADVLQVNWAYDVTDDYRLVPQEGRGDQWHQDHLRSETGLPVTYRLRGGNMEVFPAPTATTTVAAECVLQPATLTTGQSPVFPTAWHDMLIDGAMAAAWLDDGNTQLHDSCQKRFEEKLGAMKTSILLARTETNVPVRDTFWS